MPVLAHGGQPPAPHDVWTAWNLDPAVLAGLLVLLWAYRRGRTVGPYDPRRSRAFHAALLALAVALVSPLEAMSSALASAHMVQHLLLIVVAAPLLAFSAPLSTMLRAVPRRTTAIGRRWILASGRLRPAGRALRTPAVAWLVYVAALWGWHTAALYDAAAGNELLHIVEHVSFLVGGWLFWSAVIGGRVKRTRDHGRSVLLLFGAALQSTYLSLLLTFANEPWYDSYRTTTQPWGFEPLEDQQLAGVIMWVPSGWIYVLLALASAVAWIRSTEGDGRTGTPTPAAPGRPRP